MKLTKEDKLLIQRARDLITKRKSEFSSVSCVLLTPEGEIYEGVNVEVKCAPCSMCAEYSAIGNMISSGHKKIKVLVASLSDGRIFPPCGKCRELIWEFSQGDAWIILNEEKKVKLKNLMKEHWKDYL